jgi:hypothetical protein
VVWVADACAGVGALAVVAPVAEEPPHAASAAARANAASATEAAPIDRRQPFPVIVKPFY